MPLEYADRELLFSDDLLDLANWHHEGIGTMETLPGGGLRLHCLGSRQGEEACLAFFRPDLPDRVAVSYEIVIHSHGGLVINYIALRGLKGEDLIRDAGRLEPRTGVMKNYYAARWGLQSYHISFSRFNDRGMHTNTSNWRRNPGARLVGHGDDPVRELGRRYRVRLTKDAGFLQFFVDGAFAHAAVDRDTSRRPLPDYGKFGFRLVGSDIKADIFGFRVHRIDRHPEVDKNAEDYV